MNVFLFFVSYISVGFLLSIVSLKLYAMFGNEQDKKDAKDFAKIDGLIIFTTLLWPFVLPVLWFFALIIKLGIAEKLSHAFNNIVDWIGK